MKLGFLIAFIFWYALISAFYIAVPDDVQAGADIDYNFTENVNVSEFDESEVEGGGIGIFEAVGRFFLFVLFGFGMPDDTPFWASFFVGLWNTAITLMLIAWIISAIWDG